MTDANEIYLLDYGAGNVLSIFNSLKEIGVHVKYIEKLEDFTKAKVRRDFLLGADC
jgi:glutamine amidotransferase/cyclase